MSIFAVLSATATAEFGLWRFRSSSRSSSSSSSSNSSNNNSSSSSSSSSSSGSSGSSSSGSSGSSSSVAEGQDPATNSTSQAGSPPQANHTPEVTVIQLFKQYVPVWRDGKIVAYKTAYFGHVNVGRPEPQHFTVVFDTGSGHLILPSLGCDSDTCKKHRRYDRSKSETALDIEYTGKPISPTATKRDQLAISFGTGEVTGEFVRDVVCLGGDAGDCVTLQTVVATSMTTEPFSHFGFDGVLGLGLSSLTLDPHFSFFGQMVEQHPTMQPYFSVFLARSDKGRSAIAFGGYKEEWAASEVTYAPLAMQELGYWQVRIKSVRIGDTSIRECDDGACRAILDTGTSLLGVPRVVSRNMHRLLARPVPGEHSDPQREQTDCRNVPGELVHFDLGSVVLSLGVEDYSRPAPFNLSVPSMTPSWNLFCRSLLLPLDMAPPVGPLIFIWGEPMLRKYMTIYNWAEKKVGFATAGETVEDKDSENSIGAPPEGSRAAGAPLKPSTAQGAAGKAGVGSATS